MTGNYWRDRKGDIYRISDMTDNHLTATIHLIESRKSNLGNVDDLIDTIHFNMNLEFLKRGLHDPKTVEERFEQTEVKDQNEVQRIVIQMRSRRR